MELSENKKVLLCVAALVVFGLAGIFGVSEDIPLTPEEYAEEEELAEAEEIGGPGEPLADFENAPLEEEEMSEFENLLLEDTQAPQ